MLKNMQKEELEILSYTDLTELILKEKSKPLNTAGIFRIICDLLDYSEDEFANKIGDYYTSLTTDKRFVFLDTNEWDLREKHPVDIVLDEEDETDEEVLEDDVEETVEEEESDENINSVIEDEELDEEDDLDDLSIMSDEELDED